MNISCLKMIARQQPIRTLSLILVQIKITCNNNIPLYKKLAPKIRELKALGLTQNEMVCRLKISRKTILKSFLYLKDSQENANQL
ncbi:hypothetical protein LCGC14_3129880 [marine sediment metagenome]|uniref:Resolvase HTH domain-containing protein n=1 Tax=marine sediment metagenome TaxID=412755 RepID=A0A0F8VZZ1_9ZZZZ